MVLSYQQTSSTTYSASYEKTSSLSNHVLKPIHCCQGLRSVTSITGLLLTSNVVANQKLRSLFGDQHIQWIEAPVVSSLQWLKQRHQFCPWPEQTHEIFRSTFVNILQQLSVTEFHLESIFAFQLSVLNTWQNIKTLSLSNCGELNRFELTLPSSHHLESLSIWSSDSLDLFGWATNRLGRLTSFKLRPRDIESDDLPKLLEACATSLTSLELDMHYLGGWYPLIFPDLTPAGQSEHIQECMQYFPYVFLLILQLIQNCSPIPIPILSYFRSPSLLFPTCNTSQYGRWSMPAMKSTVSEKRWTTTISSSTCNRSSHWAFCFVSPTGRSQSFLLGFFGHQFPCWSRLVPPYPPWWFPDIDLCISIQENEIFAGSPLRTIQIPLLNVQGWCA